MKLIKIKEIPLNTCDAYVLKIFKNLIVTNDEQGLYLYGENLDLIKKIPWQRDVGAYMIYQSFSKNKLLLDCSEDGFLLYIDLDNNEMIEIPFKYDYAEYIFLGHLYFWFENMIIFKSSKGYIRVDIQERMVGFISDMIMQQKYLNFYTFCTKASEFPCPQDMPGQFQFIYITTDKRRVGCYDFLTDFKVEVQAPSVINHSIAYANGCFGFVNANKIQILDKHGNECIIYGEEHQEFLVAQFQNNARNLVVLNSQFVQGKRMDYLTKYEVQI